MEGPSPDGQTRAVIRQPAQKNAPSDAELIERSRREPGCFARVFDRHGKETLRDAHVRLGPDQVLKQDRQPACTS